MAGRIPPGMSLAEAISECRNAVLVEPDPAYYRYIFDETMKVIGDLGADVEEHELGLAYVRLNGLELLFGGVARIIDSLLHSVPSHLGARLGVAHNKFGAYVAAGMAEEGHPNYLNRNLASVLSTLSIHWLPVTSDVKERLIQFGLLTIGEVAALPIGALQAQFGWTGKTMWDLANGVDTRPFVPASHSEIIEAALSFPAPVTERSAVITGVEILLEQVFTLPAMRGRFARICLLGGDVFRSPRWQKRMVFQEPIGDIRRARELIGRALENHPPSGPLENLQLALSRITGEAGRQESLFSEVRREENLKESLRHLQSRLGMQVPIFHVREVEPWSRLPERRQVLVPFAP